MSSPASTLTAAGPAYLLHDVVSERTHRFRLQASLAASRGARVFEGRRFHVTASVQPAPVEMASIIMAAGALVPTTPR
jgi:hypothetical protein